MLGRVVDALGQPLDGNMIHRVNESWPLAGESISYLNRLPVFSPLDVGVRIINSLLTVGKGQRLDIVQVLVSEISIIRYDYKVYHS